MPLRPLSEPGSVRASIRSLLVVAVVTLVGCGAPGPGENGERADGRGIARADTPDAGSRPMVGTAWVIFGADTVVAEVARTPEQREQGLMFRNELPDGTGMLFVFEESAPRAFWMKDTYIPLDIAYMDESLRIVDIQQMEPENTETYDSAAPAMFALEVPQGWFAAHGVEVGDVARVVFN